MLLLWEIFKIQFLQLVLETTIVSDLAFTTSSLSIQIFYWHLLYPCMYNIILHCKFLLIILNDFISEHQWCVTMGNSCMLPFKYFKGFYLSFTRNKLQYQLSMDNRPTREVVDKKHSLIPLCGQPALIV